jgi:hypothetical protein
MQADWLSFDKLKRRLRHWCIDTTDSNHVTQYIPSKFRALQEQAMELYDEYNRVSNEVPNHKFNQLLPPSLPLSFTAHDAEVVPCVKSLPMCSGCSKYVSILVHIEDCCMPTKIYVYCYDCFRSIAWQHYGANLAARTIFCPVCRAVQPLETLRLKYNVHVPAAVLKRATLEIEPGKRQRIAE